jgi:hypothetical protein
MTKLLVDPVENGSCPQISNSSKLCGRKTDASFGRRNLESCLNDDDDAMHAHRQSVSRQQQHHGLGQTAPGGAPSRRQLLSFSQKDPLSFFLVTLDHTIINPQNRNPPQLQHYSIIIEFEMQQ